MTIATLTPATKLRRTRDVVATDMNGETVMMSVDKGTYFALTGSGGPIWAALDEPAALPEIIAFVRREFDVTQIDDLDAMITEFVGKLLDHELVVPVD
ncbi:PqqD family peptide modification chaperone [Brevundimonas poindexterae]|uniref:PqqD family peptide modification chaperone n=1 Tax=Brevundimonas poindexterae TaxID=74325 RepID=UPI001CFE0166|nr:PqqD family peptide modification chaperone [Brevundimonas poindexterae]